MPALATTRSSPPAASTKPLDGARPARASPTSAGERDAPAGRAASPAPRAPRATRASSPTRAPRAASASPSAAPDPARGAGDERARGVAVASRMQRGGYDHEPWPRTKRPSPRRSTCRRIFWLQEAGLPMTGANVARAMQLSAPTVHEMIGRLERDGYVTRGADKALAFTDDGREHAEGIVRRHRLIERFLTDVLGHPVGRGPRGGRAARARDVAGARGAHARRDRRRQDLPARPPDRRRATRIEGVPLADVEAGRQGARSCASRTRPRTCCTTSRTRASSPASRARVAETDDDARRRRRSTAATRRSTPLGRRDGLRASPTRRRRRAPRCPSSSCSPRTATAADVGRPGPRAVPAGEATYRVLAWRCSPRSTSAAQAVERVPDVDEARVERRDAEPDRVRAAEVGDDVGALDQRAADRPGLGVAQRDVRAAARGVARRAER